MLKIEQADRHFKIQIYFLNFVAERRAQLNRSRSRGPGGHTGSPQTKEIV